MQAGVGMNGIMAGGLAQAKAKAIMASKEGGSVLSAGILSEQNRILRKEIDELKQELKERENQVNKLGHQNRDKEDEVNCLNQQK